METRRCSSFLWSVEYLAYLKHKLTYIRARTKVLPDGNKKEKYMSTFVILDLPVRELMASRAYQRDLFIVLSESHHQLWDRWHISHNYGELRKYVRNFLRGEFTTDQPRKLASVVEGYPNIWEDNILDGKKAGGEHSEYCLLSTDPEHLYYFVRGRYVEEADRLRYVRREDIIRLSNAWDKDLNGPFEYPLRRIRLVQGACEQVLNMRTQEWEDLAFRDIATDGAYHESYRAFGEWRRFLPLWTRFPVIAARVHAYALYPLDQLFISRIRLQLRSWYYRMFPELLPFRRLFFPNAGKVLADGPSVTRRRFLGLE